MPRVSLYLTKYWSPFDRENSGSRAATISRHAAVVRIEQLKPNSNLTEVKFNILQSTRDLGPINFRTVGPAVTRVSRTLFPFALISTWVEARGM